MRTRGRPDSNPDGLNNLSSLIQTPGSQNNDQNSDPAIPSPDMEPIDRDSAMRLSLDFASFSERRRILLEEAEREAFSPSLAFPTYLLLHIQQFRFQLLRIYKTYS